MMERRGQRQRKIFSWLPSPEVRADGRTTPSQPTWDGPSVLRASPRRLPVLDGENVDAVELKDQELRSEARLRSPSASETRSPARRWRVDRASPDASSATTDRRASPSAGSQSSPSPQRGGRSLSRSTSRSSSSSASSSRDRSASRSATASRSIASPSPVRSKPPAPHVPPVPRPEARKESQGEAAQATLRAQLRAELRAELAAERDAEQPVAGPAAEHAAEVAVELAADLAAAAPASPPATVQLPLQPAVRITPPPAPEPAAQRAAAPPAAGRHVEQHAPVAPKALSPERADGTVFPSVRRLSDAFSSPSPATSRTGSFSMDVPVRRGSVKELRERLAASGKLMGVPAPQAESPSRPRWEPPIGSCARRQGSEAVAPGKPAPAPPAGSAVAGARTSVGSADSAARGSATALDRAIHAHEWSEVESMISRGDCGVHPKAFSVLLKEKPALATALVTHAAEADDWSGRREIAESDVQSSDFDSHEVRIQLADTPVQKFTFSPGKRVDLSPPELRSSRRNSPEPAAPSASGERSATPGVARATTEPASPSASAERGGRVRRARAGTELGSAHSASKSPSPERQTFRWLLDGESRISELQGTASPGSDLETNALEARFRELRRAVEIAAPYAKPSEPSEFDLEAPMPFVRVATAARDPALAVGSYALDTAALEGLSPEKTHSALAALAVDDVQAGTAAHEAIDQVEASVISAVASLTRLSESVSADLVPGRLSAQRGTAPEWLRYADSISADPGRMPLQSATAPAHDAVWRANLPALAELPGVSPEARIPWSTPPRSAGGLLRKHGLEDLVSAAEEVAAEVRVDASRPAMRDHFAGLSQHAPQDSKSPASRASEWLRKTHNIAISPEAIAAIHARRCAQNRKAW